MKVILHLTQSCNLRCHYCYAPSKSQASTMTRDIGQQAIDLAIRLGSGSACVSYFGGEPLLHFDLIRALTVDAQKRAAKSQTKMYFRLSTNGTLFNPQILQFCRDHQVLFAISLDGNQKAHDAQRVFANGRGSFQVLDEKLPMILEYNPYTVVTSVITPLSVPHLADSLEYMWDRGVRYMVHQLDYTHRDWTPDLIERLRSAYQHMAAFYLEKIRADEHFHLALFDDKIKTHAQSPFQLGQICDFGAKKISIAPDGRLFPCVQFVSSKADADNYCIGSVSQGFNPKRELLINENRKERDQCKDCALLGRCSNYCGCLNWQVTGSITTVPGILCAHEQMLMPIADEVGNQLWQEGNKRFLQKHYRHMDEVFPYDFD